MKGRRRRRRMTARWRLRTGRAAAAIVLVALMLEACDSPGQPAAATNPPAASSACAPAMPTLPPAAPGITLYHAPGLAGIGQLIRGPDGNLWFTGLSNSLHEVVGRVTPQGRFTIHQLLPGAGFDGITSGPDGNIWFTESNAMSIGRLNPTNGHITEFAVSVADRANTQVHDIVSGPDGALWFDVQQVAAEQVMPPGYIGRISTLGVVTLTALPNGDQPIGIQRGADGNLWSRVVVSANTPTPCVLGGYAPSATVVRVTPKGKLSELSENSPAFAGYSVGPDGSRWWMTSTGALRRIDAQGNRAEFPAHTSLGFWDAFRFVFGPDGSIWYCDGSSVLRMKPSGQVTSYHAPGGNSGATFVASGPDGRVWFAEGASGAATLGAITLGAD